MNTLINWLIAQIKHKARQALAAAGYAPRYYISNGDLIFKRGWRGKRAFVMPSDMLFQSKSDWV